MNRERMGSPLMARQKVGSASASPVAHHGRSASLSSVRRNQTSAAAEAAKRLAQVMASHTSKDDDDDDDDDNDEISSGFQDRFRSPLRNPLPQKSNRDLLHHGRSPSAANLTTSRSMSPIPFPSPSMKPSPPPIIPSRPKPPLQPIERPQGINIQKTGGRLSESINGDRRKAASYDDKIDVLEEEKEELLNQLRGTEEKWKAAELRAKELEKQVASLGEGISLESRLLSRKEAALQQREAALKAAKQTKDARNDEIVALQLDIEATRDEAATAVQRALAAEGEARSLRNMTQRMVLSQEEMEEVVLKRCWLSRYWGLALRYGIHSAIATPKHEYWSSFAPLPLEVVLSAGQKAREDPEKIAENGEVNGKEDISEIRAKSIRDFADKGSEGNIENMLSVEKGLRELSSLKVEDAVMLAMVWHRRPSFVRIGQTFPDTTVSKALDSPRTIESFDLSAEEIEDAQFKQAWLIYFWRRAKSNFVESDIADERLQFWISRSNQSPTSHDAVDIERGLSELKILGLENQLWEASRKHIQEAAAAKSPSTGEE